MNQTEFVVPRTLPFTAPADVTRGYSCKEFVHTVQSKVINLVRLSVNHTRYHFDQLCLATSRHSSAPVAVVYIIKENLAVAKSDIIPAVEPTDSGYDTSRSHLARSDLLAEEDEGYEEVHECTEDAYGKKICNEDDKIENKNVSLCLNTQVIVRLHMHMVWGNVWAQAYAFNSLYTEFHFLLRLLIPCMIRISTSAMS